MKDSKLNNVETQVYAKVLNKIIKDTEDLVTSAGMEEKPVENDPITQGSDSVVKNADQNTADLQEAFNNIKAIKKTLEETASKEKEENETEDKYLELTRAKEQAENQIAELTAEIAKLREQINLSQIVKDKVDEVMTEKTSQPQTETVTIVAPINENFESDGLVTAPSTSITPEKLVNLNDSDKDIYIEYLETALCEAKGCNKSELYAELEKSKKDDKIKCESDVDTVTEVAKNSVEYNTKLEESSLKDKDGVDSDDAKHLKEINANLVKMLMKQRSGK